MLIYRFNKTCGEFWMARRSVKNRRFSVFRVEKEVYEILTVDGHHYWNVDGLFIKDPKYFLLNKYQEYDIKYKEATFYQASEIYDQIYLSFGFEVMPKLGHRKLLCKRKYPESHHRKPLVEVHKQGKSYD